MKDGEPQKFQFRLVTRLLPLLVASIVVAAPPLEEATHNNNRAYEWYCSQYQTGQSSNINCGPASIHMAMMYQDNAPDEAPSPEEIRNWRSQSAHDNNESYWNVDVGDVLNNFEYEFEYYPLRGKDAETVEEAMKAFIRDGYVLIVCINMSKVAAATDPEITRFDRFYNGVNGHFIVLKGYLDDGDWFVVYDPWVMSASSYYEGNFPEGDPMGKERYYDMGDIVSQVIQWNRSDTEYAITAVEGGAPIVSTTVFLADNLLEFSQSQLSGGLAYKTTGNGPYVSQIYDISGRKLYQKNGILNGTETTRINTWATGVFILHHTIGGKTSKPPIQRYYWH